MNTEPRIQIITRIDSPHYQEPLCIETSVRADLPELLKKDYTDSASTLITELIKKHEDALLENLPLQVKK